MTDSLTVDGLYRNHHGWLLGLLRRRLGCHNDAADLAQDAFLRLLIRPRELHGEDSTRAYLSSVARGLCVDLWRRREIERAYLDALHAQGEPLTASPEHQAIILETLCEVDTMLRALPPRVAEAFVMAQIHGLSYREIGAHFGVGERMVRKYMARAMLHCALIESGLHDAG